MRQLFGSIPAEQSVLLWVEQALHLQRKGLHVK